MQVIDEWCKENFWVSNLISKYWLFCSCFWRFELLANVTRVFEQSAVVSPFIISHSFFWNLNLPITRLQNVLNIFILIQREEKSFRNKNAFEGLKFFSSVSRVFEQSAVISTRYWIHHSMFWNINLPITRLQNPYNLFILIQREEKSFRIKNLFKGL